MLSLFRAWRRKRDRRCSITEEWDGYFIGRQFCSTHDVWWDNGGYCPKAEV